MAIQLKNIVSKQDIPIANAYIRIVKYTVDAIRGQIDYTVGTYWNKAARDKNANVLDRNTFILKSVPAKGEQLPKLYKDLKMRNGFTGGTDV